VTPAGDPRIPTDLQRCPRCSYRGEGISYFSRPGHVGLLIGVSLFTYGIGGLVYWLARRKHRICPNCGLGWEYSGRELAPGSPRESFPGPTAPKRLPSGGGKRRFLGSAMVLLASFLIMMGFLEFEAALIVVGSVIGAGGSGTFFWGWKALQERRQAVTTGMQREILRLADGRGGTLTVTEVAASLNLSLPAAEKLLVGMDDGFRVRSDITDDGVIVYEFPEVLHRKQLEG
jgi:ribosomal protein S27AE